MQPLSNKKRNRLFLLFGVVFLLSLPFLILYSTGFRFSEKSLIKTGGLYVHKPLVADVSIALNDKPLNEKITSFLQRYYFVQSLRQGEYKVQAEKEGYHAWQKTVPVLSQRITEVAPFLVPAESPFEEIPKNLETTKTTDSTTIPNPLYTNTVKLFNEKAIAWRTESREYELAKETYESLLEELQEEYADQEDLDITTLVTIEEPRLHLNSRQKIEIWQQESTNKILASLESGSNSLPYFCESIVICSTPNVIVSDKEIDSFNFFPGRNDIVIYTNEDGLFAAEIDRRSKQHVFLLYAGKDIEFTTENDDTIYIKDGNTYLVWEIY